MSASLSASDIEFFEKQELKFLQNNRESSSNVLGRPFLRDENYMSTLNPCGLFTDEAITSTPLLSMNNFQNFINEVDLDLIDDSYENIKQLNYTHDQYAVTNLALNLNYIYPSSYTQILNSFQASATESTIVSDGSQTTEMSDYSEHKGQNELRLSQSLKLRSSAKNAIVTYNSLQKVFHARYDEGRSNARLQDISNSYLKYPFLNEEKSPYTSLLGKNKESFFKLTSYNKELKTNFNDIYSTISSLNTYFSDLPFLLSAQSDASRHL